LHCGLPSLSPTFPYGRVDHRGVDPKGTDTMIMTEPFARRTVVGLLAIASSACTARLGSHDAEDFAARLEPGQCAPAFAVTPYNGGDQVQNQGSVYECK